MKTIKFNSLRIAKKSTFAYHTNGMFYFRIFGYGLVFSDIHKFGFSFSERNGYKRYLKIGNLKITTLKPNES